jgi:transcriptional regulator with XRE-family HTH domain
MIGSELRDWRKRNRYTQDMLRLALELGSRQTIITWEKSEARIPLTVELALLALEHLPEKCRKVDGHRFTASELPGVRENVHGRMNT